MSDYKNLKVEINKEQPLDDVVKELERLSYKDFYKLNSINAVEIETFVDGTYDVYRSRVGSNIRLTTLKELKEMQL